MSSEKMMFEDRTDAGRKLGKSLLERYPDNDVGFLVLSIPRGGVVVGREVARVVGGDHQALVVKKISAPDQEELAIGAMAPDLEPIWDEYWLESGRYREQELRKQELVTRVKVGVYLELYGARLDLEDKRVVVVDDGMATGETMRAAAVYLNRVREKMRIKGGDFEIVVAVPVSSSSGAKKFHELVDGYVCLAVDDDLRAVGEYYQRFDQVSENEAEKWLR